MKSISYPKTGAHMIHHQRKCVIEAGQDEVWAVIGRFMHIDEFAPLVTSVDPLTNGEDGIGSRRRCYFDGGGSMVEEVTEWEPNRRYRVRLSETDPMPMKEVHAELRLDPLGSKRTEVTWSMDYRVKYGPLGWVLGQTMMKIMLGKIIDGNLGGLTDKVGPGLAV